MILFDNDNSISVTIKDLSGERKTYQLTDENNILFPFSLQLSKCMNKCELKQRMDADGINPEESKIIWQLYHSSIYRVPKVGTIYDAPLRGIIKKAQAGEPQMDKTCEIYAMLMASFAERYNLLGLSLVDCVHKLCRICADSGENVAKMLIGADIAYLAVKMLAMVEVNCGNHFEIDSCIEKEGK